MRTSILVVVMVFMMAVADVGAEISVPGDYSTIQGAIDAAVDGNTIVVSPGTYYESIDFGGKDIVVTSTDPWDWDVVESTIIDANGLDHVVVFDATETAACLLEGLTLTGGDANYDDGTGVHLKAGGVFGGLVGGTATSATINRCLIVGNRAEANGSAVWNFAGEIRNCRIEGNYVGRSGVLARCYGPIVNCLISGNTNGLLDKFVMHSLQGPIVNCTIVNNFDSSYPGIVFGSCAGAIENCVVWGNVEGGGTFSASTEPAYSCIEGYSGGGVGNISSDPCFVDAAAGDYHLLAESPCINAGDPEYYLNPAELDIDGEPRIMAGLIDMGSDEFTSPVIPYLGLSENEFNFIAFYETNPDDQILEIATIDGTTLNWQITETCPWLTVSPVSGSSTGELDEVTLSVDVAGLEVGGYDCELTISDSNAVNSPQTVSVNLSVGGCYAGPDLAQWILVGMPASWCTDTQCHGDANDDIEMAQGHGNFTRVGYDDITILLNGFFQRYPGIGSEPGPAPADPDTTHPWIAADFNHYYEPGQGRNAWVPVGYDDVTILVNRFMNLDVPEDCQTATPELPL